MVPANRMVEESEVSVMPFETVQSFVEESISSFYRNDWYLVDNHLSEWTISYPLYFYLRKRFGRQKWKCHVDGEYNHMALGNKVQLWRKLMIIRGDKKSVRPDIIIHRRGPRTGRGDMGNLLWIELKTHGGSAIDRDIERLKGVTGPVKEGSDEVTGYGFGLSLLIQKTKVECRWFREEALCQFRLAKVRNEGRVLEWRECAIQELTAGR